jgi:16S rRNA C967 or C1407 C5-methylase (RsmB/RsmF family)/NOL1/NOP2/fmu family ribosome biogenesis protein
MLPEGFIERIGSQRYIDKASLFKALGEPSQVSIRINYSKWNKTPQQSTPVPWCNAGYYLDERPSYTMDPLFHAGCYYPQEASGMFLEQALLQSCGSMDEIRVLDLCGAPGGKSTHLSNLIGNDSLLVSNEVIRSRAGILSETLTKWGSGNALVTQNDPSVFGRLPAYFDLILVDAPCSGEGMFRDKVAVSEWSVENTAHCSVRQKRILMDVWPSLKENGILVYSTCTFNPGENEENIKWLIDKHEAECVRLNVENFSGITEIDFEGIFGYGFYPGKVRGEGLFMAVIRKTGGQKAKSGRTQHMTELHPSGTDIEVASRYAAFPKERLLKWGNEIYAVPCSPDDYTNLFRNLKIVKAGTRLLSVKKTDYLPSHDLALSCRFKRDAFPQREIALNDAIAFLRRDNFIINDAPKGWNVLTYNEVSLGFINNIGNRFNNYFPVEWRIKLNASALSDFKIIRW